MGAGDLARGCVNTQLLILPSVGMVMVGTIRPIGKIEVSEGLEIQFSFPYGTEDAVPVCLGAGDLARGCVNTQLLILPSVGMVMVGTIRPIGKIEVSEGLEIQFSFPYGTEDAVPVCLI